MDDKSISSCSQLLDLNNFIPKKYLELLCSGCQRFRIFDPATTLYCFMNQILTQSSSKASLANLNLNRIKNNLRPISMNTAAYTKAKQKLNENVLKEMATETGKMVDAKASSWKWKDRDIFLVDGTVLDLEDTDKIRTEYPKAYSKGKFIGQPKIRLLGLFSFSSGAFLDAELGKYSGKGQGETTLVHKVIDRMRLGSILIMDRYFTSYFLQNYLQKCKIDYVIRLRDKFAKRMLKRKSDVVIDLERPAKGAENYYTTDIAQSIRVRIIKSTIRRKGFREATTYIITSLLNEAKAEVEQLYLQRWGVELDIRNLKCTLGATMLKSKTPEMIRKELWVHLIAYNLIRNVNCAVSNFSNKYCPRKISFKSSLNVYINAVKIIGMRKIGIIVQLLQNEILKAKYRREPRVIKRRPDRYLFLTISRDEARRQTWGYKRKKMGTGKYYKSLLDAAA